MKLDQKKRLKLKRKLDFYLDLGRLQLAEKLLGSYLKKYQQDSYLLNLSGMVFYKQSRFPEALKQFQKACQLNPEDPEGSLNLIAALCDLGFYQRARDIAGLLSENTIVSHPGKNPETLRELSRHHLDCARSYEKVGLMAQALSEYQQAIRLCESQTEARMGLAKLYLAEERIHEARRELNEVLQIYPEHCEAHTWIGILNLKEGRRHSAKKAWEKAHRSDPKNSSARGYFQLSKNWSPDAPV